MAGWLFVLAYLGVVTGIVRRATAINSGSFEDGLFWQRVEIVSFSALPQNVIVIAPAAAAAVAGTMLCRSLVDRADIWLHQLVRAVAGTSYVVIAIAVVGMIGVFFRNPDSVNDLSALLGRLGGILMAAGMITLCLEAERGR